VRETGLEPARVTPLDPKAGQKRCTYCFDRAGLADVWRKALFGLFCGFRRLAFSCRLSGFSGQLLFHTAAAGLVGDDRMAILAKTVMTIQRAGEPSILSWVIAAGLSTNRLVLTLEDRLPMRRLKLR
jgi:hypothetical protein